MNNLCTVVERITFYNENNGYAVIKCKAKGYIDLVTVVGSFAEVNVGSVLSLIGEWKTDAKYGRQFSVFSYEETLPATVYGIEKYLGSGLVKGIGPKFAKRIVQTFGEKTLDVIETAPDELIKVAGIGKLRVERIKSSWTEQKEIKNIMLFLQGHDVSTSHFYRDDNAKEIDIFVEENGMIHPLEIKKSANPEKKEIRKFSVIGKTSLKQGCGGIICMFPAPFPIDQKNSYIPSNLI